MKRHTFFILFVISAIAVLAGKTNSRKVVDFNNNWKFCLNDTLVDGSAINLNTDHWRTLNLPHDWSIESDFSKDFASTPGGGALPGGLGWYRKNFTIDKKDKSKKVFIEFDGVYQKSKVWLNGHLLGYRPNGYISFSYDVTKYVLFGKDNVISVRVDNTNQPNSRWYSGSGIYRNVRLVITNPIYVENWGTYVTTPVVSADSAAVSVLTTVNNDMNLRREVNIRQKIYDANGIEVASGDGGMIMMAGAKKTFLQNLQIHNPVLWSIENPYLYKIVTSLYVQGILKDEYTTFAGVRTIRFDVEKGFFLNGKSVKINGVCNHHDLGALGSALNLRALERQLQIMKNMGVNAIRTSHNPPAPELLDLCDRMGILVMDEAFDMWKKKKTKYDYSADFEIWHERDITDQIKRDRNHPSVIIWSIGNEVGEQWGDTPADDVDLQQANIALNNKTVLQTEDTKKGKFGKNALLTRHLAELTHGIDPTRPVTAACNGTDDNNPLFQSEALDLIGFNYHENEFAEIGKRYPRTPFIVTESVSSLNTRGYYVNPSDSVIVCPKRWDIPYYNPTQMCSAYDNCRAPWGTLHEDNWKIIKKYPHISGQFIWTGFDYLGEPTPYWWPSRSSFFGIVDLAGFPKDVYYMYQSEWTDKDVLHVFPHWNWQKGDTIDVWAYYNKADNVELFLNGKSLGKKSKQGDDLHVMWRVPFEAGTIKAVSTKDGRIILSKEINTSGVPVQIKLTADCTNIKADGKDLAFVTVEVLDLKGYPNPLSTQLVKFSTEGEGFIAGTDNGDENDHNSLKKPERRLFFGKCMAIVQNNGKSGTIKLKASIEGIGEKIIEIYSK